MKTAGRAVTAIVFGLLLMLPTVTDARDSGIPQVPLVQTEFKPVQDFAPLYCFPMNMNDGNIFWTYTTTVSGRNNYRYEVNEPQPARTGTTSCVADPKFVPGAFSADFQTCTYAGVAAVAGAFIPGVGTVGAVYFFATTCGIALLVN